MRGWQVCLAVTAAFGILLAGCEKAAPKSTYTPPSAADVDKLIADLKSPDAPARARAALELGRLPEHASKSEPALKQALSSEKDQLARTNMERAMRELSRK